MLDEKLLSIASGRMDVWPGLAVSANTQIFGKHPRGRVSIIIYSMMNDPVARYWLLICCSAKIHPLVSATETVWLFRASTRNPVIRTCGKRNFRNTKLRRSKLRLNFGKITARSQHSLLMFSNQFQFVIDTEKF